MVAVYLSANYLLRRLFIYYGNGASKTRRPLLRDDFVIMVMDIDTTNGLLASSEFGCVYSQLWRNIGK
ncbi:hypothetical protein GOP47_0030046 [Adiantum capillus-veneris]|nr:hypothetical protein GOP47_0030046 [Adiantum capillus-veneris]